MNNIRYMSLFIMLLLVVCCNSYSGNIEVSSRINISAFEHTKVRHSYCLSSKGSSSTNTSHVSNTLDGDNNSFVQSFSYHGKNYLRRKVSWGSETTSNSFKLLFAADKASFSADQSNRESHCRYRYWKAHSTSAETTLKARGAFYVPSNVWLVRVRSKNDVKNARLEVKLFNEEYNDGVIKIIDLYSFNRNLDDKYFLVNASTSNIDTYIHFDLLYKSKTMLSSRVKFEFEIDFISAVECIKNVNSLSIKEMLSVKDNPSKLDSGLVNLACMLNPSYVSHSLSSLHLYDLNAFFGNLNELEKEIENYISINIKKDRNSVLLDKYNTFLKLLNRIRFYYGYEILKETFDLFLNYVEYENKKVDSFLYIEILRERGILYLFDVFDNLLNDLLTLENSSNSYLIKIEKDKRNKFNVYLSNLLLLEVANFQKAHKLIYRPKYLALYSYKELLESVDMFVGNTNKLRKMGSEFLAEDLISRQQLDSLIDEFRQTINSLRLYVLKFSNFRVGVSVNTGYVDLRVHLLTQIESMFQINIKSLFHDVGLYYYKHFEDPLFQDITVGGRRYESIEQFIDDYSTLLKEISK